MGVSLAKPLAQVPVVEVPRGDDGQPENRMDPQDFIDRLPAAEDDAFSPGQSREDAAAGLQKRIKMEFQDRLNLENYGIGVRVYGFPIPVHLRRKTLYTLRLREKYGLQAVAYQRADGTIDLDMDPTLLLEKFAFLWCGLVSGMWNADLIKELTGENDLLKVMQRGEMQVLTKPIPMSWCDKSIIETKAREVFNVTIMGYKLGGEKTLFPRPEERLPSHPKYDLLFSFVSSNKLHKIINRTRTDLKEEEKAKAGYAGGVQSNPMLLCPPFWDFSGIFGCLLGAFLLLLGVFLGAYVVHATVQPDSFVQFQ